MKVFVVVALTLFAAVYAQNTQPATTVNPDKKCVTKADPKVAGSKNDPADCNVNWPTGCKDTCPPTLKFIDDGTPAKALPEGKGFTPVVMNHKDSRDVLRKLVKEKDTTFVIQFFKEHLTETLEMICIDMFSSQRSLLTTGSSQNMSTPRLMLRILSTRT